MHLISLLSILLLFIASSAQAGVRYVKSNASPGGDGNSWTTAYNNLQSALNDVQDGDQIWIARGTYRPDNGTNDRAASFEATDLYIQIFGGFAGTETSIEQRNISANETILSGEIGQTAGDFATVISDNSYHVFVAWHSNIAFDGITIARGNAVDEPLDDDPGRRYGGGIYAQGSAITFKNCKLIENIALRGGAAYTGSNSLTVENSLVVGNEAIRPSDNLLYGGRGGAFDAAFMTVKSSRFFDNSGFEGAALYSGTGNAYIENSVFSTNYAPMGVISFYDAMGQITNSTFVRPAPEGRYTGYLGMRWIVHSESEVDVVNSIFRNIGNEVYGCDICKVDPWYGPRPSTVSISYSSISTNARYYPSSTVIIGQGMLLTDPLFTTFDVNGNYSTDDLRLTTASPQREAGNSSALVNLYVDILGYPRTVDSDGDGTAQVDMGAYEVQSNLGPVPTANATPTVTATPTTSATGTPTVTRTATGTATHTPTRTLTSTPSATFTATYTSTPVASATIVATSTAIPTSTLSPTATSEPLPTLTSTPIATQAASPSPQWTVTPPPTSGDRVPDLSIERVNAPRRARIGDEITVEVMIEVSNFKKKSQQVAVKVLLVPVGVASDTRVMTVSIGKITVGKASKLVKMNARRQLPRSLKPGSYNLIVLIDSGDVVAESDEFNNRYISPRTLEIVKPRN